MDIGGCGSIASEATASTGSAERAVKTARSGCGEEEDEVKSRFGDGLIAALWTETDGRPCCDTPLARRASRRMMEVMIWQVQIESHQGDVEMMTFEFWASGS